MKNEYACKRDWKEDKEARKSAEEIEALERNSENYIYEYFSNVKRQIDLRREKLKAEIDENSDGRFDQWTVESAQDEFIKLSKKENELTRNIEAYKKQLDEIEKQIYGLDVLNKNLKQTINNYNGFLIGNSTY